MEMTLSAYKHDQVTNVNFPAGHMIDIDQTNIGRKKDKVVIILGATGTGKTRFSIYLATRFNGEIINSDKIQVYKGLDIVTNKVTYEERHGIPHHLLGTLDPEEDFTNDDFVYQATLAADAITRRGRVPIIAGGSNSYIKALVIDDNVFRSKYECCFLWVDVSMPVLHTFVAERVDQMVNAGLVEEGKEFYDPKGDYSRGVRRAIGVPEMDEYYRNEFVVDVDTKAKLLERAIDKIKVNTYELTRHQLQKILMLREHLGYRVHRIDATEVFLKRGEEAAEAFDRLVSKPGSKIVGQFLCEDFASSLVS